MTTLTEVDLEQAALDWLANIGWRVAHGLALAPDTPGAEVLVRVKGVSSSPRPGHAGSSPDTPGAERANYG